MKKCYQKHNLSKIQYSKLTREPDVLTMGGGGENRVTKQHKMAANPLPGPSFPVPKTGKTHVASYTTKKEYYLVFKWSNPFALILCCLSSSP